MTKPVNYGTGKDGRDIALEARAAEEDRLFSPSAARNRDAIRDVFLEHMPVSGHILEIGSGTGEHAAHIAGAAPGLDWQPSDPDPASRRSIDAWAAHGALAGLRPALDLDVTAPHWWRAITPDLAGMVSINMIHIAPFAAAEGLFAGAAALLEQAAAARLMLYGPFLREGISAPSNLDFDASLKSRDPAWGVRDLDREIIPLAAGNGFAPAAIIEMPANNLTVLFARR